MDSNGIIWSLHTIAHPARDGVEIDMDAKRRQGFWMLMQSRQHIPGPDGAAAGPEASPSGQQAGGRAEAGHGALVAIAECAMALFGARCARICLDDDMEIGVGTDGIPTLSGADDTSFEGFQCAETLIAPGGRRLGTLEVVGDQPRRSVTQAEAAMLQHLGRIAAAVLEQQGRLRVAAQRFEDIFATSPSPSWIYDPASLRFLDVNEAAIRFYGYSRQQFLGMTVLDIRPAGEHQRMIEPVRGPVHVDEAATWRHVTASGRQVDVVTHGRRMTFEGIDAIIVVAIDRTDVQALRKDLSEAQLTLDTIIAALPVGLFLKDMQDSGRYLLFNPTMENIVGRDARNVIGRVDQDIFGIEEGDLYVAEDREVMTTAQQHVYEADLRRKGPHRRIRTVKKPIAARGSAARYLLGVSEDVTESRKVQDRIAYMALHDALTDLPNRVKFQQHVDRLISRARTPKSFALFYLDLDFFKTINDTYGHPVGDALLKDVASRLKANTRRRDLVARLGGDEFAILARISNGEAEALKIADRVLKSFDTPFDLGECLAHVDTSIGIALSNRPGQDSGDALMRHADIALYAAKAEGRGLAKVYVDRMSHDVEIRQRMSEDLRLAIAEHQFELSYQPLYALADDRITGFEALIRWCHPKQGLIPPGDFIPVAEQTGLIVPIGDWVLREACRAAATWPGTIKVAVNLSAVQFKKPGLEAMIERNLAAAGLSGHRLELEITESVLLTDSGANLQILHRLKALGIHIALDDFGTGHSSLSYLRAFPFDKIKMDRTFVADVCHNPGSLAIVRAVIGLGSSLSMTTTAEGVETAEQSAKLKAEGFDEVQGYLIGRPMPADDARRLALAQAVRDVA